MSNNGFAYKDVNAFFVDFIFYQLYAFVLGYSNMAFFDYLRKVVPPHGLEPRTY